METMLLWMATYALHSTFLLGVAWLFSKVSDRNFLPIQESLWKLALFAGILTAGLQVGFGLHPLTGSVALFESETIFTTAIPEETAPIPIDYLTVRERVAAVKPVLSGHEPNQPRTVVPELFNRIEADKKSFEPGTIVLTLWLTVGGIGLLMLMGSYWNLGGRLRRRIEITDGPLPLLLGGLLSGHRPQMRIRLTQSDRITVPLAKGVLKPEICLPRAIMPKLTLNQQEAVLAHETAHHLHGDPFWLLASRAVERFLFFQPLNRVARASLQKLAEYRCDDWAAARTGRPAELARCLTEVARWACGRSAMLPAPGMASRKSELGTRVHRLLERNAVSGWRPNPWWVRCLLVGLIGLIVLAVPGFTRDKDLLPSREPVLADIAMPSEPETFIAAPLAEPAPEPVTAEPPGPPFSEWPTPAEPGVVPVERLKNEVVPSNLDIGEAPLEPVITELPVSPRRSTYPEKPISSEMPAPSQHSLFGTGSEPSPPGVVRETLMPTPEALPEPGMANPLNEDGSDDRIEHFENIIDRMIETHGEDFEEAVEAFDDALDSMEDRVDERLERMWLEWRAERIEEKIDRFADRADDVLESFDDELERIEERFEDEISGFEGRSGSLDERERKEIIAKLRGVLDRWQKEYRAAIAKLTVEMNRYDRKYGR